MPVENPRDGPDLCPEMNESQPNVFDSSVVNLVVRKSCRYLLSGPGNRETRWAEMSIQKYLIRHHQI